MLKQEKVSAYKPWLIWGIAAIFCFYQYLLQTSSGVLIEGMSRDFRITSVGASLLASAYFYAYIFLQMPSGALIDKMGAKRLFRLSIPLTVLTCFLLAWAPTVEWAFAARLLMGLATAPGFIGTMCLAATWFEPKRFALLAGLTEMLCMLGGGLGQNILSWTVTEYGWRTSLIACGLIGIIIAIAAWLMIENAPAKPADELTFLEANKKTSAVNPMRLVISSPMIWALGLFDGMLAAVIPAFAGMWGVPYMQSVANVSLEMAAYGTALIFIGVAISSTGVGVLSDRMGRRKPLMWLGTILALLGLLVMLYIPISFIGMLLLLFLIGLVVGVYMLGFAVVREMMPQNCQGTALGFINMCSLATGALLLQPLIGFLLGWSAPTATSLEDYTLVDYQVALSVLPIGVLVSLLMLFFIKETYCRSLQQQDILQKGRYRLPTHVMRRFWRKHRKIR